MNDTTNKYKAHLMANGFHQKFGCDYLETFSPIVKSVNIWFFLTNNLSIQQIDVNNVFINGILHEDVYMA